MSEGGEKTELPTPKKIRDAREKGQVAKSTEVVTTATLAAVVGFIWVNWSAILDAHFRMFDLVAGLHEGPFHANAGKAIFAVSREVILLLLPILGVVSAMAIAANYLQIGSIFSFKSIAPSLDKVSPMAGFKRIFSMKQLIDMLKSILKIIFLSCLLYVVIREAIAAFLVSLSCGIACIGTVTGYVLGKLLLFSFLAFFIVAAIDLMYQRYSYTKSLMMSKDEIKREYKESEGDPHVKGHRKQVAHEILMGDEGHAPPKDSALVVNPTHLAVLIQYEAGVMPLPRVIAKGREGAAHRLRAAAEQAGVPVFRNVPLARALFATTQVNDDVPEALFDAVAEVLGWVSRHRERLYQGPLTHGVIDMEFGDHRRNNPDNPKPA